MRPVEIAIIDYAEPQVRGGELHTFVILGLISGELEWQINHNDATYLKRIFKLFLGKEYLNRFIIF